MPIGVCARDLDGLKISTGDSPEYWPLLEASRELPIITFSLYKSYRAQFFIVKQILFSIDSIFLTSLIQTFNLNSRAFASLFLGIADVP